MGTIESLASKRIEDANDNLDISVEDVLLDVLHKLREGHLKGATKIVLIVDAGDELYTSRAGVTWIEEAGMIEFLRGTLHDTRNAAQNDD